MDKARQVIRDEEKYILGTYARPPIVLDYGKGCYLYDTTGKRYLDMVSGIAVNALGYGDAALTQAIAAQAVEDALLRAVERGDGHLATLLERTRFEAQRIQTLCTLRRTTTPF